MELEPALVPELSVRDWERSRAFYRDMIGFAVSYERPEEGFSYLKLGSAALMIDQTGVGRDFIAAGAAPEYPFGRGMNLQIRVPSVSAILERLAGAGTALLIQPEDKWYRRHDIEVGNRQFVVADPDGYLLRLFEDLGERAFKPRTA